jgi:hypothetical protein
MTSIEVKTLTPGENFSSRRVEKKPWNLATQAQRGIFFFFPCKPGLACRRQPPKSQVPTRAYHYWRVSNDWHLSPLKQTGICILFWQSLGYTCNLNTHITGENIIGHAGEGVHDMKETSPVTAQHNPAPDGLLYNNQPSSSSGHHHHKCQVTMEESSRGGTWSRPSIRGPVPLVQFWRPVMCATQWWGPCAKHRIRFSV